MKFLLIQEAGRHKANRDFREALSLQRALRSIGHFAEIWGLNYRTFSGSWALSPDEFNEYINQFDVVFMMEQYEQKPWIPDLSQFKGPRVFWSVDSHCNLSEHVKQVERHQITHLLSSTRQFLDYYHAPGLKKFWFPNCYDYTLIYPMPEVEKVYPVGFCGNLNNRGPWLDLMDLYFMDYQPQYEQVKRDIFVIGEDMVRAINSYKIHFNRNIDIDINYRTFETLGCKTILLTNYTPGLEDLFEIGRELVTYSSGDDLLSKIRYYLEHEGERESIAEAGYARVKRDHTYFRRAQQLVEILNAG